MRTGGSKTAVARAAHGVVDAGDVAGRRVAPLIHGAIRCDEVRLFGGEVREVRIALHVAEVEHAVPGERRARIGRGRDRGAQRSPGRG
jgi:hypothetical protein